MNASIVSPWLTLSTLSLGCSLCHLRGGLPSALKPIRYPLAANAPLSQTSNLSTTYSSQLPVDCAWQSALPVRGVLQFVSIPPRSRFRGFNLPPRIPSGSSARNPGPHPVLSHSAHHAGVHSTARAFELQQPSSSLRISITHLVHSGLHVMPRAFPRSFVFRAPFHVDGLLLIQMFHRLSGLNYV